MKLLTAIVMLWFAGAQNKQAGSLKVPAALSFTMNSIDGKSVDLSRYLGQVVLMVNVASQCGYTPQYAGLEELHKKYAAKGLRILGFPSNDFGEQEPGTNAEIKKFCEANFDVTFPLADKEVVSGDKAHPLYRWAARQTGALGVPTWNFHKILIGRDGRIVDWFTAAGGMGARLDRAVEAALGVRS